MHHCLAHDTNSTIHIILVLSVGVEKGRTHLQINMSWGSFLLKAVSGSELLIVKKYMRPKNYALDLSDSNKFEKCCNIPFLSVHILYLREQSGLGYSCPPYPVWHGNCSSRGQQSSPRASGSNSHAKPEMGGIAVTEDAVTFLF